MFDGLVQDCNDALALELLHSCTEPLYCRKIVISRNILIILNAHKIQQNKH